MREAFTKRFVLRNSGCKSVMDNDIAIVDGLVRNKDATKVVESLDVVVFLYKFHEYSVPTATPKNCESTKSPLRISDRNMPRA